MSKMISEIDLKLQGGWVGEYFRFRRKEDVSEEVRSWWHVSTLMASVTSMTFILTVSIYPDSGLVR